MFMSCCVQFHLNQIDIRTISGVHFVHGSLKCQRLEDNFDAGDCTFSCAAHELCNDLPLAIRKYQSIILSKSELKTFVFRFSKLYQM